MFRLLKLKIISYLIPSLLFCSSAFSQVETVNFLWKDGQNIESNGTIALKWQKNSQMGYWELQITVKWFDPAGADITDPSRMPFIYLSDYDIEIISDSDIKCLNFSVSDNIYEIQFQESGELRFNLPAGIENPGTLEIIFRYALSREDILNANIDPVRIPGMEEISMQFPDTGKEEEQITDNRMEPEIDSTNEQAIEYTEDCQFIRDGIDELLNERDGLNLKLTRDDANIGNIREEIDSSMPGDTVARSNYERTLQSYLEGANILVLEIDSSINAARNIREVLTQKNLPNDSLTLYRDDISGLEDDFRALRREYVQFRVQIRGLLETLGSSYADVHLAGIKKGLEVKYGRLFNRQIDSAQLIQSSYAELEPKLVAEIRKGPGAASRSSELAVFVDRHEELKATLDSLGREHREEYFSYRADIEETGPVNSIETLHVRFDDILGNTNDRIDFVDSELSRLRASMDEQGLKTGPFRVIIVISLVLFIILVIIILYRSGRKRTRTTKGFARPDTNDLRLDASGIFKEGVEESAEYYMINVPEAHPDISLSEVHFHLRAIKTVYHLIQGAMIEKKPGDFGALLFGRQYKSNGNSGSDKHIAIIEKVVSAAKIRPEMSVGTDEGALLVEEIEKLVEENKKMALLGWVSSALDRDLEMPENQAKVYKTYFRERWQLACLVYPGSDLMEAGLFVKRKSGFFEPRPENELRFNWDELFQFAVDPPSKKQQEGRKRPDKSSYVRLDLNRNWSDSIVESLYLHSDVVGQMAYEKENNVQLSSGQPANGFFYGQVWDLVDENENKEFIAFEVYVDRLIPSIGTENPREMPGSELLGWFRSDDEEIFELLKEALPYHEEVYKAPHQFSMLVNAQTNELRIFSRKHSLEMNNNTIETEEFNLDDLLEKTGS